MSVRSILFLLILTATVSIVVNGQTRAKTWPEKAARTNEVAPAAIKVTSQVKSWSTKFSRDKVVSSIMTLAVANTAGANKAATIKNDGDDDDPALEDTWRATETFGDGSVFRVLFTFGAGRNRNNGVVTHSDELFLVAAPSCLTAQGVWKRTTGRNYIATDEAFCFDTNNGFAPAGKVQFKTAIKLNRRGTEFNGNMHVDGFDLNPDTGDLILVFSTDAVLHGERMPAEAP
jgi:hypothetical protein